MSAKKKMIIAISAFAMVVLAAVVAVVAVLAAQNVTVKSSITISYTTVEIQGQMTASYKEGASGSVESIGTINPDGTDPDGEMNMGSKTISLTKENNYVEFIFTFTNTNHSAPYTAELTGNPTNANFTILYSAEANGEATANSAVAITVPADQETPLTYKVRYTLNKFDADVTLTGNFVWTLQTA